MKLTNDIDWKQSPAHIDFLSKFTKPRDINQVMDWQYLRYTIKEKPKVAIDRLIRDGALIPCSLEESMERIFKVDQLQKMLRDRGLPQKGIKSELIKLLIAVDYQGMEAELYGTSVMKCSENGMSFINEFAQEKQKAMDTAREQSYSAILVNKQKEAYRAYLNFQHQYIDPDYPTSALIVREMEYIQISHPKVLGNINTEDLKNLRAAVCMSILWKDEAAIYWLPASFQTTLKSNEVAANYLKQNAKIKAELDEDKQFTKRVSVTFSPNDVDSCELCMALNGKIIDIDNFPDLPFEGCKSDIGCKCILNYPLSDYQNEVLESITVSTDEDAELENTEVDLEITKEIKMSPNIEKAKRDEVVDFEMTGTSDNVSDRSGFILVFADGSKFEFYYEYLLDIIAENYEENNAAKRFFDVVNELTDKFVWNLRDANENQK